VALGDVSNALGLVQSYGRHTVRQRVGRGFGVSAVALLWPHDDGWPPEIDFAEDDGVRPGRDAMDATLHYGPDNAQIGRTVHADFTRWHVMGVEWTRLVYTLDGRPWAAVRSSGVPSRPMELDLQASTGTCGDRFQACPDASTPARVDFQIDRVRIDRYRRAPLRR
jgi:beta-glucanase (GH16 family)